MFTSYFYVRPSPSNFYVRLLRQIFMSDFLRQTHPSNFFVRFLHPIFTSDFYVTPTPSNFYVRILRQICTSDFFVRFLRQIFTSDIYVRMFGMMFGRCLADVWQDVRQDFTSDPPLAIFTSDFYVRFLRQILTSYFYVIFLRQTNPSNFYVRLLRQIFTSVPTLATRVTIGCTCMAHVTRLLVTLAFWRRVFILTPPIVVYSIRHSTEYWSSKKFDSHSIRQWQLAMNIKTLNFVAGKY